MTTRVTICDDSSFARKQLVRALPQNLDVELTFATNGIEGLQAVRDNRAELMFLDLTMPEMDGYEVLEHIFKEELDSSVIVVSGDIQPEARERVMSMGAIAFIKKPSDPQLIGEILKEQGLVGNVSTGNGNLLEQVENIQIPLHHVYQEIANVAMGQAADLLARYMDAFVVLPVPSVKMMEITDLQMALMTIQQDEKVSAVFQGFIGERVAGEALLLFNHSDFSDIAKLLKFEGEINASAEIELMMDISSILMGTFLKAFAAQMDFQVTQAHPRVFLDSHITNFIESDQTSWKETLSIEIDYRVEGHDINCDLLILFAEESIQELDSRVSYYAS